MASSSAPASGRWQYDAFLSFRGKDTRTNFVDHLYAALHRKGIFTFKDDERLEMGQSISPELSKAIEQSRFAIVVFSDNYASSSWCLEELAKIMDCKNRGIGQTVIPVFYGSVDPSQVRRQTGSFADAFVKHEERYPEELGLGGKVTRWRDALFQAAEISGLDVKNTANGYESKCVDQITEDILSKLGRTITYTEDHLVGVENHVEKVMSLMGLDSNDNRAIGIWGMAGIGKSTIAHSLFNSIRNQFEGTCFLSEVRADSRKYGLAHLQKKLLCSLLMVKDMSVSNFYDGVQLLRDRLCHRKVLVILDDLDHKDQLDALAGNLGWFGIGSKIIIIARDKHLLRSLTGNNDENIYEVPLLNKNEANELFNWNAFKGGDRREELLELSNDVVSHTGHLPLALKVLGSFLYGRDLPEWRSALARLKEVPDKDILQKLQISFEGLEDIEQQLFLDIACFFKGMTERNAKIILESFGFHPDIGIKRLCEKSVLVISDNILQMHDLLQEMGWHIVKEPKVPGKYSRLWLQEDICSVLIENTGTEAVEGIVLDLSTPKALKISPHAFQRLNRLRYLKVHGAYFSQDIGHLSNELRWLNWHGYPSKSLPASFRAAKLVGLELCYSRIIQLWKHASNEPLEKLKFIKLCHSQKLVRTPDISLIPNLEELDLKGCTSLVEVHKSITDHRKLIVLNLNGCKNLMWLPRIIRLNSLRVFNLSGCEKLDKLPDFHGNMQHLSELYLACAGIKRLPLSIEHLCSLRVLNLANCISLPSLPDNICSLRSLRILNLNGCSKFESLPEKLGDIECLEELRMDGTRIVQPPSSICQLKKLTVLSFEGYKGLDTIVTWSLSKFIVQVPQLRLLTELNLSGHNLSDGDIPDDFGSFSFLGKLNLSRNNFVNLPSAIGRLSHLWHLQLDECKRLKALSNLPKNSASSWLNLGMLRQVSLRNCYGLLGDNEQFLFLQARYSATVLYLPMKGLPEMLSYRGSGSAISVNLPPRWWNDTFVGFTLCCIPRVSTTTMGGYVTYSLQTHEGEMALPTHEWLYVFDFIGRLEPEHAFFVHLNFDKIDVPREMCDDSRHGGKFEARFYIVSFGTVEMKEWGVQLVYKEDMETLTTHFSSQSGESQPAVANYSGAVEPARDDHDTEGAENATNSDISPQREGNQTWQVIVLLKQVTWSCCSFFLSLCSRCTA